VCGETRKHGSAGGVGEPLRGAPRRPNQVIGITDMSPAPMLGTIC